jgi:sugar lactone lactonase YvrE
MHVEGTVMKRSCVWLGLVVVAACGGSEPAQPDAGIPIDAPVVQPRPATLELLAGDVGGPGNVDGTGAAARFNHPASVAIDAAGNAYVADQANQLIRKVTPAGQVTTLAGAAGVSGTSDGAGAQARFHDPAGIAVAADGSIYVADQGNHTIRKITEAGVATLAGTPGQPGSADGTGAAARFDRPAGLALDRAGNLVVADEGNDTIRQVTAAGVVTTIAGVARTPGSHDGAAATATFSGPSGVAVDGAGNVIIADRRNSTIRQLAPDGAVTTLAGAAGKAGTADGAAADARFAFPVAVAVDATGVLVADGDHVIRRIAAGAVTTLAGNPLDPGSADGPVASATFRSLAGLAADAAGVIYFVDGTEALRTIRAGVVATRAGAKRQIGSADGTGAAARFDGLIGVAADRAGNVYAVDTDNATIRKITPAGVVTTLAGTARIQGSADGTGAAARFAAPTAIAVDARGNAYVTDLLDNTVRKITPAGVVTTLAGLAGQRGSADGIGAAARFDAPLGVAVDAAGTVYVADGFNQTIRKITPAGEVTTLAGTAGARGSADGTGSAARFSTPSGVAVDGAGNVYIADTDNHAIRKVTAAGVVTTLAGNAGAIGSADGTGAAARFDFPVGVAVDSAGTVYVADTLNSDLRRVSPAGVTTTVGGVAGVADVVLGDDFRLAAPQGLAISGDAIVVTELQAILVLRRGVTP